MKAFDAWGIISGGGKLLPKLPPIWLWPNWRMSIEVSSQRKSNYILICFYSATIPTINEMASLKVSSIKNGYLYCKRNASENIAVISLCSHALHIIDKYQLMCFDDYLLPIFTHKHNSPEQQLGRIKAYLGADKPNIEEGFKDTKTWKCDYDGNNEMDIYCSPTFKRSAVWKGSAILGMLYWNCTPLLWKNASKLWWVI